ncbi:MAG: DNA-binding domain-containing protein [Rubrivivax sp.]|nr:DNA-binding domain-containing protein [Rubrivivax sp.]
MNAADREALRQQMLLRALLGDARPGVVGGWLHAPAGGPSVARGLAAYRANAGALAERALAAAYPTLQQLLGDESFGRLARHHWQRQPPQNGDIALWGGGLAAFVADAETLADEPYLADVARLEWAVHSAATAADAGPPQGLELLATHDPAVLGLALAPGTTLVVSPHPVVAIWQAHRAPPCAADDGRFAAVRAAFAAGAGDTALVTRRGWQPVVRALDPGEAAFTAALLASTSLAGALYAAGPAFHFEPWLLAALQQGLLAAVIALPAAGVPSAPRPG